MRRRTRPRWILLLAAAAIAAGGAAACGDPLRPYPQFTISPRTINLARGASASVKIVLAGPNKSESWTVESGNPGVAAIAQTGTGATVSGVAAGTTRLYVVARTEGFGEVRDSATVNITP
jgi:hypothetical protein